MHKENRIILTGGSGFIGQALIQKLLLLDYKNIISLNLHSHPEVKEIKQIICDIDDKRALQGLIEKGDVVVHLACSSTPMSSEVNLKQDIERDLLGCINLFEVCGQKKISKIIYVSSGGTVYGSIKKTPSKESDPTDPKNFYGALKLATEKYLCAFSQLYTMKYTILRLANPYGKKVTSQSLQGAIDIFLYKALHNEEIQIYGDGKAVRDYIHINDVVEFFIKAIERDLPEKIYNIGSNKGTSLNKILKIISDITKRKLNIKHLPKRKLDLSYSVLDTSRAQKVGWKCNYSLKKGIQSLYKNFYGEKK